MPTLELVLKSCEASVSIEVMAQSNYQSNAQSNSRRMVSAELAQSNSQSNVDRQWRMSAELAQERVLCTMSALMIASARHPQSNPQSNSQPNSQFMVSWVDLLQEMISEQEQGLGIGPGQRQGLVLAQGQGLGLDTPSITSRYHGVLWRDLLHLCPQAVRGCVGDTVEGGYLLHALLEGGHRADDNDPLLLSTPTPTPASVDTLLPAHVLGD